MKIQGVRKNILRSLLVKEFTQLRRDKRMIAMLFGVPVGMMLMFGYAVNTDVKEVRMAVLDEDRSSASRAFLRRFTGSGYFILSASLASPREASALLDGGEVDMFLHVPAGFSDRAVTGKGAEVQLIVDGTDSSRASVIMSYVTLITNDFSFDYLRGRIRTLVLSRGAGGLVMKESIGVRERSLFNPDLASRNFFLPGVLGLLIALVTVMLTSMSVVKERESGTMEQIIVSPLRPNEFILGKTLPFAIIGFFDVFVITLIAIGWFGVPFNGSFVFLLVGSLFYILSMLAVGLYISTISYTQQQAMLSTFLFFIPAILFSGFVFPIYAMPEVIQVITWFNPTRYFITIVRGVFLKGAGVTTLWDETGLLLVMGIALLYLSARRFSRRME